MSYELYLIIAGATLALVLSIIIIKEGRRRDRKDEVIAYPIRNYSVFICILISYFLIGYFKIYHYIIDAKRVYEKISPKYVNEFYKMFNCNFLNEIHKYFLNINNDLEFDVYILCKDLSNVYFSILVMIIGLYYLYMWSSRNAIYEEGIYINDSYYSWGKIGTYNWEKQIKEKNGKKVIKYYDLELMIFKNKISRFLSGEQFYLLNIRINQKDKETIDYLLKKNVIEDNNCRKKSVI